MQIYFLVLLTFLWIIFGSFASVLIVRFYTKEWWIMNWRSHCKDCNHELWFFDLFPIFSYIFLSWKCRYCKQKISYIYPLLELVMWIGFMLVWLYLVDYIKIISLDVWEIIKLVFFLYIIFVVVIFSFYDILYQLIPTEILGPAILVLLILLLTSIFSSEVNNFFLYYVSLKNSIFLKPIFNALLWAFTVYTFLYIQIFFPWIYYAIEKKKYKIILVQFIDYFIIPFYMLASVFINTDEKNKLEETEEEQIYTWMWHWDLWIAIFMWFVWGFKIAILWLALAYLIWSIIWLYIILIKKQRNTYIAFWPFLGSWLILALIFYNPIINWGINILWWGF